MWGMHLENPRLVLLVEVCPVIASVQKHVIVTIDR